MSEKTAEKLLALTELFSASEKPPLHWCPPQVMEGWLTDEQIGLLLGTGWLRRCYDEDGGWCYEFGGEQ